MALILDPLEATKVLKMRIEADLNAVAEKVITEATEKFRKDMRARLAELIIVMVDHDIDIRRNYDHLVITLRNEVPR